MPKWFSSWLNSPELSIEDVADRCNMLEREGKHVQFIFGSIEGFGPGVHILSIDPNVDLSVDVVDTDE